MPSAAGSDPGDVLLVDDDERMLRSLRRVLKRGGFDVTVAEDGRDALQKLEQHPFEVVVTDVTLPRMSGLELLGELRRSRPQLPVVVYTGLPDARTSEQARQGGALAYLVEPFRPHELVDAVALAASHGALAKTRADAVQWVVPKTGPVPVDDREHRRRSRLENAVVTMSLLKQRIEQRDEETLLGHELFLRTSQAPYEMPRALFAEAERLDALVMVGRAVRDEVAFFLERHHPLGLWFVNQRAEDLADPQLFAHGARLSRQARHVVLEFREGESLARIEELDKAAHRLRALGYRLCLDDVGAGFSGLDTFARMAPDMIKLDVGLCRGIDRDPARSALVHTLCDQAHQVGALVIAEGVETPAQKDTLLACGCDGLQGYGIGPLEPLTDDG